MNYSLARLGSPPAAPRIPVMPAAVAAPGATVGPHIRPRNPGGRRPAHSRTSARTAHVISERCPAAGGGMYWIAVHGLACERSVGLSASRGLMETSLTEHGVAAPDVLEEDS